MFDPRYLYKELFVVVDEVDASIDMTTIGFVKEYEGLLTYIKDNNKKDKTDADAVSIYHGTIIPAKFIHTKINNLIELHLISVSVFDNGTSAKDKYFSVLGNFLKVEPFNTLQDVKNFVGKVFLENHCDISDLFFFIGYKMELADIVDLNEEIDEAELVAGNAIAKLTKEILDLVEIAELTICQEIVLGHRTASHSKVLPILSNCLAMGA